MHDNLIIHIAQVQHADSVLLHHIAEGVNRLLQAQQVTVPPELAEAIGESKVHHDALLAALATQEPSNVPK